MIMVKMGPRADPTDCPKRSVYVAGEEFGRYAGVGAIYRVYIWPKCLRGEESNPISNIFRDSRPNRML